MIQPLKNHFVHSILLDLLLRRKVPISSASLYYIKYFNKQLLILIACYEDFEIIQNI